MCDVAMSRVADASSSSGDDDDSDVEVFANGFAFNRAASWLGASSTLTADAFAAVETSEIVETKDYRPPRLGLGAKKGGGKRAQWEKTREQHATKTALDKAFKRRRIEEANAATHAQESESESDSEEDRSKASVKGKRGGGKGGGGCTAPGGLVRRKNRGFLSMKVRMTTVSVRLGV